MQIAHVLSLQQEFICVTVESNCLLYLFIIVQFHLVMSTQLESMMSLLTLKMVLYSFIDIWWWFQLKCLFIYPGNPQRKTTRCWSWCGEDDWNHRSIFKSRHMCWRRWSMRWYMFFLLAEGWNTYFFPPGSSYSYWKPVDERKRCFSNRDMVFFFFFFFCMDEKSDCIGLWI